MTIPAMAPSESLSSRAPSSGTRRAEVQPTDLLRRAGAKPAALSCQAQASRCCQGYPGVASQSRVGGRGQFLPLTDRLCVDWPILPVMALCASQVYIPLFL